MKSLYASASRAKDTGEVILKVVNTSKSELSTDIKLNGIRTVQGPAKVIVLTSRTRQTKTRWRSQQGWSR